MPDVDELLNDLGRLDPFEIDWKNYDERMLRRLSRAATVRRRRNEAWSIAASVVFGAAAAVGMMLLRPIATQTTQDEKTVAAVMTSPRQLEPAANSIATASVIQVRSSGRSLIVTQNSNDGKGRSDPSQPSSRKGGSGEIRFGGFNTTAAGQPTFIAVAKKLVKARVN